MAETNQTEILVAIGRIEEILKSMNGKLDAMQVDIRMLEDDRDRVWKKINEIDTEVQVLVSRQGPRVHWSSGIAIVAAAAALILGILDRIYLSGIE